MVSDETQKNELFSAENAKTTSLSQVLSYVVGEDYVAFKELHQKYIYSSSMNTTNKDSLFRHMVSILKSMSLMLKCTLERKMSKENYKEYCENLDNIKDYDSLISTYVMLHDVLDHLELTKIDTRKNYDRTSFEESNKVHGL